MRLVHVIVHVCCYFSSSRGFQLIHSDHDVLYWNYFYDIKGGILSELCPYDFSCNEVGT